MRKGSNNIGFSLLELIIILAIMSAITAIVLPQFLTYIKSNRTKACRINREAILSIYERCVYAGELDLTTGDFEDLLNEVYIKTSKEINQYKKCPDGGIYRVKVINNKAYITCNHPGHEFIVLDFSIKNGTEEPETVDNPFPTPPPIPTPTSIPTPTPTPIPTKVPTITPFVLDRTWPYDDDERWNKVGRKPGSKLEINVPTKLFQGRDGTWYVIVARDRSSFTIHYEWNTGPEVAQAYLIAEGNEDIISWSGVTITEPVFINDNRQITGFHYGDIVVCDGRKYIMSSRSSTCENWPLSGNKSGNFYLVSDN